MKQAVIENKKIFCDVLEEVWNKKNKAHLPENIEIIQETSSLLTPRPS
jgi:hypothetical protein